MMPNNALHTDSAIPLGFHVEINGRRAGEGDRSVRP